MGEKLKLKFYVKDGEKVWVWLSCDQGMLHSLYNELFENTTSSPVGSFRVHFSAGHYMMSVMKALLKVLHHIGCDRLAPFLVFRPQSKLWFCLLALVPTFVMSSYYDLYRK
jgi:hypothetical protein